jgi:hypothetical protein
LADVKGRTSVEVFPLTGVSLMVWDPCRFDMNASVVAHSFFSAACFSSSNLR